MYRSIFAAAAHGTISDVQHFLDQDINIDVRDDDWASPLMYAIEQNPDLAVAQFLIDSGADMNTEDGNNQSIFARVALNRPDRLQSVFDMGFDPDWNIFDALIMMSINPLKVLTVFLDNGLNPNQIITYESGEDETCLSAYLRTCQNFGGEKHLHLLLDAGADVNLPNSQGITPLMHLLNIDDWQKDWQDGKLKALELLLAAGADPNAVSREDRPVLDFLLFSEDTPEFKAKALKLLVEHGLTCNYKNLEDAAHFGTVQDCEYLIHIENVDPTILDEEGKNLLMIALIYNRTPWLVQRLILDGLDPNARDKFGRTALMYAAMFDTSKAALVKTLYDMGADLSVKDNRGQTVLQYAANFNAPAEVMKFLINAASDAPFCFDSTPTVSSTAPSPFVFDCPASVPTYTDFMFDNNLVPDLEPELGLAPELNHEPEPEFALESNLAPEEPPMPPKLAMFKAFCEAKERAQAQFQASQQTSASVCLLDPPVRKQPRPHLQTSKPRPVRAAKREPKRTVNPFFAINLRRAFFLCMPALMVMFLLFMTLALPLFLR